MSWRMTPFTAAIVVAGGIAVASVGFAADTPTANPAPQGQGMMGGQQGQGMMGGQQGQGMMNMMPQMTRMVENCNGMMETANNNPPAPAKPPEQKPPG
jgi:hypothetical protein